MNRKQKISLLNKIADGKLKIESLEPPKIYIFTEDTNVPGIYAMDGKQYNETEYQEFCREIRQRNNGSICWHEGKTYEDTIITMNYCHNSKPLKIDPDTTHITLNLNN
jgi:hypothetical protein